MMKHVVRAKRCWIGIHVLPIQGHSSFEWKIFFSSFLAVNIRWAMLLLCFFFFFSALPFSPFYSCTQTTLKVNLNPEATFSINVPTFLQINPKWQNERLAKPFLALYWPSALPLSLSVRFISRSSLQGSGMAPSLHAGWRERLPGGFFPSCPSIWGPQTRASPFVSLSCLRYLDRQKL